MSYVVKNEGLIKDPYALQEFQEIQAKLKGFEARLAALGDGNEKPDQAVPTPKGDPTNPDRTTPPASVGVRWLTGPWLIGVDGDGTIPKIASYAVQIPAALSADQHNYALSESAIILELYPNSTFNLTGLRQAIRQRRIVGILNRGAQTMNIVNQSASSEARYRFSWGTTGEAGETIAIPTGTIVWVYYDATGSRWRIFGVPFVGWENLPPSIFPDVKVPPWKIWSSTAITDDAMTLRSLNEGTAAFHAASGVAVSDSQYGFGAKRQTGAVSGNFEGVLSASGSEMLGLFDPTVHFLIRTEATITDIRIKIGIVNSTTGAATDDLPDEGLAFRYSTSAGDPGWVALSRTGGVQSVSGQVAAFAASTVYRLTIRKSTTSVFFSVNGGAETEVTENIPDDLTTLRWMVTVVTLTGASRELTFFRTWMVGGYEPD